MLTEAEYIRAAEISSAMAKAANEFCPIPTHIVIAASNMMLAANIAALPDDQRAECLEQTVDGLPLIVQTYVDNPIGIKTATRQ